MVTNPFGEHRKVSVNVMTPPSVDQQDDGFGLIEVIVAMFLLLLISVGVLPLLIGVTQASVSNKTLVAATTLASGQLAPIRATFTNDATGTTCSSGSGPTRLQTAAATAVAGPTGSGLSYDIEVDPCPTVSSAYPAAVGVEVRVYKTGSSSQVLATLTTKVMVASQ